MRLRKLILPTLAALVAITPTHAMSEDALSDAQVLAIYTQVNSFDIETAFLAISKNCSPTTTELAEHLSKDHLWVRRTVLDLAVQNGISYDLPSNRLDAQIAHDANMARLSALDCSDFDSAFLEHDVAFHEAAISAVKNILLPTTKSEELKAHFQEVLPAFEQHLAMAISVKNGGSVKHAHGAKK